MAFAEEPNEPILDPEPAPEVPPVREPVEDQGDDDVPVLVSLGDEASLGETSEEYELAARSLPSFDDLPLTDEPEVEGNVVDAEAEGDQNLSATVREPGNRFPHRGSRRMRRRRGGEGRPDGKGEPRPEGSAPMQRAVEPPPAAEPEIKTVARPVVVADKPTLPSITDLLKEGQEIIVQIAKEPLGQKGARITSHIALPGRYVVYMPTLEHLGVSRKIASDEERQRLKKVLQAARVGMSGGFIVRTAGEGHTEEEIGGRHGLSV